MPWENTTVPAEEFLTHKGITIYHTYKNDQVDEGVSDYYFVFDEFDCQDEAFDVRELSTYREPLVYEPGSEEEAARTAVIAAIENGELVKH